MCANTRNCLSCILAALLLAGVVHPQDPESINRAEPGAPKKIVFVFSKLPNSVFLLDRLIGQKIELERGEDKLVSSPIKVKDDRGICSFASVPPGEYKLTIQLFRLKTKIWISERSAAAVGFSVTIGTAIEIVEVPPPAIPD